METVVFPSTTSCALAVAPSRTVNCTGLRMEMVSPTLANSSA
jgi:hypothetical protein